MAKTFYALMIVLCLFSSVLTSVAPQQISFNPEYVSPPPAEISYLSLDAVDRGAYTDFRMSMVAYSLEGGPFIAGLFALYSSWEACWSQWVNGPGRIDFSVSCSWRKGYQSIGHPLFISRGGGSVWVQSIDINGVGAYCLQGAGQPDIKDVSIDAHKDLGGILVHVFLNAPGGSSNVRVRIYRGSQIVYDFAKTVNIPAIWVYSPCIDLRIDFGPLHLKKAGSYIILMQGKVWDSKLSRFVGIPSEAWSRYCSPNIVKLKKTSELYQQLYQLQEEYTRLKTSYSDLRDNYDSLSREYGALQKNYSLLEDSFTKLERKYKEIEGSYINLLRNYEVLSDKYSSLEESYSSLEKDYLALKLEQEKLKSKYQEIKSLYDQMKVEYEKIQDELTLTRSRLHTYLVGFIIIAILAASLIIITIIRARQRKLLIN